MAVFYGHLINSTVAANSAPYGDEVYWHQFLASWRTVSFVIRWTAPISIPILSTSAIRRLSPTASPISNCPVQGNLLADPLFVLTNTLSLYADSQDSPCIDQGIPNNLIHDLDGLRRPLDGDGVPGAVVDIGASNTRPRWIPTATGFRIARRSTTWAVTRKAGTATGTGTAISRSGSPGRAPRTGKAYSRFRTRRSRRRLRAR